MPICYPCPVCKAKRGEPCRNVCQPGLPLPGRDEHWARSLPPDRKGKRDDD